MVEPAHSIGPHPYSSSPVTYAEFQSALSDWGTSSNNSARINRPTQSDMQTICAYLSQGCGGSEGATALSFLNTVPAGCPIMSNFSQITQSSNPCVSDDLVSALYTLLTSTTADSTNTSSPYTSLSNVLKTMSSLSIAQDDMQDLSVWLATAFSSVMQERSLMSGAYDLIFSTTQNGTTPQSEISALMSTNPPPSASDYAQAGACFQSLLYGPTGSNNFYLNLLTDLTNLAVLDPQTVNADYGYPPNFNIASYINQSNTPSHVLAILTLALDGPDTQAGASWSNSIPPSFLSTIENLISSVASTSPDNALINGSPGYTWNLYLMTQGLSSGNDIFSAVLDLLNSKE